VTVLPDNSADVKFDTYGEYRITATITTPCEQIVLPYFYVYIKDNTQYYYSYSPNPANDQIIIEQIENSDKSKISKKVKRGFEVKLLSNKGDVLKIGTSLSEDLRVIFDTKAIPEGIYFLHIKDENKLIKKQIIIKH
jgi:hypothetical protein